MIWYRVLWLCYGRVIVLLLPMGAYEWVGWFKYGGVELILILCLTTPAKSSTPRSTSTTSTSIATSSSPSRSTRKSPTKESSFPSPSGEASAFSNPEVGSTTKSTNQSPTSSSSGEPKAPTHKPDCLLPTSSLLQIRSGDPDLKWTYMLINYLPPRHPSTQHSIHPSRSLADCRLVKYRFWPLLVGEMP